MIGFFTDPYPDELLYSACARYHRRVRNISKEATARDLFGTGHPKIVVDLPTRLNYLAAQLPPATYTVSKLIDEYTMLPLYAPFIPGERHATLRRDMRGEGGRSVHGRLGVLSHGIDNKYLRFCPTCVEEDWEPYWHRTHQVPGIEVCPKHAVFLSDSAVDVRHRGKNRAFVTTRQAMGELSLASRAIRPLDPNNREHHSLLCLARDAAWVLSTRIEAPDQNALRHRYLRLLLEHGLATYGGKVRHARLDVRFLDHYSPALLERLGCGLDVRRHWLQRLLNNWRITHHPLHHLLLIQFLGCTAEEFFHLPAEIEPFGKGPWPCLNPAGGHYREPRVGKCLIKHTYNQGRRLIGTFLCECGFSYMRAGPDMTGERRYQYDRIMSFGEGWYEKLQKMSAAGSYSRSEMALALDVSVNTIQSQTKRLKMSSKLGLPPTHRQKLGRPRLLLSDSECRDKHRKRWYDRVAENPSASRTEHRRAEPEAYNWLAKNDKEWLEENSPDRVKIYGRKSQVDWLERDNKYSAAVRETAAEMLTAAGRPVRASRNAIANKLGILAVVTKVAAKLPLTNKTLDDVTESITAFVMRRIRWAAECYRQEHITADRWKLQTRAAVSNKMARDPEVKAMLEECARALREMNEAGWKV